MSTYPSLLPLQFFDSAVHVVAAWSWLIISVGHHGSGIRTTCQFNSKISYPGTNKPHAWHSDPLENHGFDATKRCFFADGCALDLNADASALTVKSARNERCLVDLTVTRTAPGFQVGKNGTTYFGTDLENPWGSMRHAFWPRCSVQGGFTTPEGKIEFQRAIFIHALQGMKPHHAGTRGTPHPPIPPLYRAPTGADPAVRVQRPSGTT